MRTVILHYHLFKNAGTSVDHILQQNFPDAWHTREFTAQGGDNSDQVAQWITQTPTGIAFSSHTMVGPLPQISGVAVIPILLLRDPVDRIRSAYHFERQQQAETKGAQLAKAHDLPGYVGARLAQPGDRQCRNFQTARLASMAPGGESELARAVTAAAAIRQAGVLGLVAQFQDAMHALSARVTRALGPLNIPKVRANRSTTARGPLDPSVQNQLIAANHDDLALLDHIRRQTRAA